MVFVGCCGLAWNSDDEFSIPDMASSVTDSWLHMWKIGYCSEILGSKTFKQLYCSGTGLPPFLFPRDLVLHSPGLCQHPLPNSLCFPMLTFLIPYLSGSYIPEETALPSKSGSLVSGRGVGGSLGWLDQIHPWNVSRLRQDGNNDSTSAVFQYKRGWECVLGCLLTELHAPAWGS